MLIRQAAIPSSEITPEYLYRGRRDFIRQIAGAAAIAVAWPELIGAQGGRLSVSGARKGSLSTTGEELTPFESASTYNNYYELSRKKEE